MDIKDNPQLQSAIAGLINQLTDTTKAASDFTGHATTAAQQQLSDIIHQYIVWGISKDIFYIFIGIVLLIVSSIIFYKSTKALTKIDRNRYSDDGPFVIRAVSFVAGLGGVIMILSSSYELIQIYVAPKVWLIQQVIQLVNSRHT